MKKYKVTLFSMVLILIFTLVSGCRNNNDSLVKKNIEEFLKKKTELYEEQQSIINSLYVSDIIDVEAKENDDKQAIEKGEGELNEILTGLKNLLTEGEYNRLLANRYLIDKDLIEKNYTKTEIKSIEYEKASEDEEKMVYKVKYTENLYYKNELKEERKVNNVFTLEKINNKWLISHID